MLPSNPMELVYHRIAEVLKNARATAYHAVNSAMVQAYWEIGRIIVEEEQQGRERAEYGKGLIPELAQRLTREFGKGFTETNLKYIRQFYALFPIRHALRDELSWTHYRLLLKVEKEEARQFYLQEAINSRWSTSYTFPPKKNCKENFRKSVRCWSRKDVFRNRLLRIDTRTLLDVELLGGTYVHIVF